MSNKNHKGSIFIEDVIKSSSKPSVPINKGEIKNDIQVECPIKNINAQPITIPDSVEGNTIEHIEKVNANKGAIKEAREKRDKQELEKQKVDAQKPKHLPIKCQK